jgi:hypothetical protein
LLIPLKALEAQGVDVTQELVVDQIDSSKNEQVVAKMGNAVLFPILGQVPCGG